MADIEITGSARGAVGAVETARRSLQSLASTAPTSADTARWKAHADSLNLLKKAASGVAPQFTGIFDSMEEFAEGAEKVGGASMAARVGVLALGSGFMAAAAATVAATAAIVASSIEVIATLDASTLAISRHDEALVEANKAYVNLTHQVEVLRVEVAGQLAPALGSLFDGLAGGVVVTGLFANALYDVSEATGLNLSAMARYIPVLGQILNAWDNLAGIGHRATSEAAAAVAAAPAFRFDMEADTADIARAQAAADGFMLVQREATKATAAATAAHKAHTSAIKEQAAAYSNLAAQVSIQSGMTSTPALADATVRDRQSGLSGETSWGMAADEAATAATQTEDAWRGAMGNVASITGSVLGAISSLWQDFAQGQTQITDDMSASERRHARERFKRQKAAAIGEAWIKSGLAFLTTMAEYPYPANIILAVAGAAVSSVQIGLMASRQMTAHRGGILAPDEVAATTVLRSEQVAVVPRRGGGVTSADVARQSTGERSSSAAPVTIVQVVLDGVARRTRPFGGMSPMLGRAVTA